MSLIKMKKIISSIELINKFKKFLIKFNFLANSPILLGISGGQDSICLIILFLQISRQFCLYFGTNYCNHLWKKNNLYNNSHVSKINFSIKVNLFFTVVTKKILNEKNSRSFRYQIFHRISYFYDYKILAIGHTKTDQIETFLLNLFRGSSKNGLSIFTNRNLICNKSIKNIFLPYTKLNE